MAAEALPDAALRRDVETLKQTVYGVTSPYVQPGLYTQVQTIERSVRELVERVNDLSDNRKFWITMAGVVVSSLTGLAALLGVVVNIVLQLRAGNIP